MSMGGVGVSGRHAGIEGMLDTKRDNETVTNRSDNYANHH